ncbi:sensor histidine kinase [Nocardioides psychrotolerans]|uniref:sensor histidine kinase n=1 Tax=Nocardioides psychrotolerans TaxID=1005945 RepID=UPI00313785FE
MKNPIARFLAIGAVTLIVLIVGTNVLAGQAANREALAEASLINEVLAESVANPAITAGMVKGNKGALDRFDRTVVDRLDVAPLTRVNIWSPDGVILYSDIPALRGRNFGLSSVQQDVLERGGTDQVTVAAGRPETELTQGTDGTVQIFTRIEARNGAELLFEGYYSLDDIEERRQQIYTPFQLITVGALLVLLLLVTPILRVLTRQVSTAAEERERLLRGGLEASDAERRRIARDLHDGVVQDLAGTSFSIAAASREPNLSPTVKTSLTAANQAIRDTLKSLRALLAEIHPPEIHAEGLAAALEDLTAPASALGIQASISVEGAETATDQQAALVWRVAQEAVRNALRHAQASTIAVTVRSDGKVLVLEVVDDGIGFAADAAPASDRYGLRGMASLVRDSGGRLRVESAAGEGTAVRLEVAVDE